ncbi:DUF2726 domain-containing protein [Candidatus Saccharibacteria bacterium]|nr:DUF2726 domain-containing protein [Candidatus Saccharibacteria bacterium]
MDSLTWFLVIFVIVAVFAVLARFIKNLNPLEEYGPANYKYSAKKYIMTSAESECLKRLERICGEKYYIFPQIQLSSLLNHKIKGQNWQAALSRVQRKTVDFVLAEKTTMQTAYAIELDDRTHDRTDRVNRDSFVNQALNGSRIPLVRLRNINRMTDSDIIEVIKLSRLG